MPYKIVQALFSLVKAHNGPLTSPAVHSGGEARAHFLKQWLVIEPSLVSSKHLPVEYYTEWSYVNEIYHCKAISDIFFFSTVAH